ncbi:hypothetical protein GA707_18285 [Nostocoides sp. F2B08]|uniref:hypothetical protein n=1 Tax=Nostocoides sp. F2B08 TaxID=2653936 RepID=UPI0012639AAF|nr:hypothetical protein [Tetrasphaera sp. F2B08]KAB7741032.1 hypothetical protein GA707_18285 [Tetrasphaera sp. F2B08]
MTLGGSLVPVSGSTAGIRSMADGLRAVALRVGLVGERLADLRGAAAWESPAGDRFAVALGVLPPALDQVRHRYLAAADALDEFAGHHDRAASETERQAVAHRAALDDVHAIEDEITRAAAEPGGEHRVPDLYARQRAAIARGTAAEEEFGAQWRWFDAAAAECATRLRAAAQDGIVDTGDYEALRRVRDLAQDLTSAFGVAGMLPTPVKAFSAAAAGVGAGVVMAADTLLLLGYDEGSWSALVETAGWNLAGRGAATMSSAAGIGAVKGLDGRWRGQHLATGDRLRQGRDEVRTQSARQRAALRTPVADRELYSPRTGGTRPATIGPRQRAHVRLVRAVEDRIAVKVAGVNDRWRMAASGGSNAVVLQVGADAVRVAAAARATEQHVRSARETVPAAAERTRDRWQAWREGDR